MSKPYFTLSKSTIRTQYEKVASMCDIVSYSSKTNPLVTPLLEETTDCNFSVHLENELIHIQDKSRVLFLAQGLDDEQLERLFSQGINRLVVDNEEDLDLLLTHLQQHPERKVSLLLRAKLKENSIRTERYFVFGMPSETVNKRIGELREHPQIASLGIHFHRKSQNMAEWSLIYEVEQLFTPETLAAISIMNIGGGLPSVYANTNEKVFDGIYRRIEELRTYLHGKNIQLMIEPGRFIAAPAGKLYCTIKAVYDENIIVDASVYNTDMDALIVPVKLLVEGEHDADERKQDPTVKPYIIKGKTPCSMDLFRYRVWLREPKKGDEIIFLNAGAYNFTTDFCDLEKIETKVIE